MKIRRGRPPRLMLDAAETRLLAGLSGELSELLADGETATPVDATDPLSELVGPMDSDEPDTDPARRRLLPDAYRDDDTAAAEWRRLGRSEVRNAKSEALAQVIADLARTDPTAVPLDDEHLPAWLGVLTDLRLALATRLQIEDDRWWDEALRLPDDDPRRGAYAIYEWLTTCQGLILEAVG